ncbi:hypothetical protein SPB21_28465 [Leptothoe sp. ISB3NOV94-8A]
MTQQVQQPLTSPDKETAIINAYDRWSQKAIITNGELISKPKFQILELALITYHDADEGRWFVDVVQVMGMEVSSSQDPKEAWTYSVQYITQPSESHMSIGFRSECADYNLQKIEARELKKSLTRVKDTQLPPVTFRNHGFGAFLGQ